MLQKCVLGIIAINSFDNKPIELNSMFIAILSLNLIAIGTISHHIFKYNSPDITFEKFLLN